jgi:hypothetical protein
LVAENSVGLLPIEIALHQHLVDRTQRSPIADISRTNLWIQKKRCWFDERPEWSDAFSMGSEVVVVDKSDAVETMKVLMKAMETVDMRERRLV